MNTTTELTDEQWESDQVDAFMQWSLKKPDLHDISAMCGWMASARHNAAPAQSVQPKGQSEAIRIIADAMHEWKRRAEAAEAKLASQAAPSVPEGWKRALHVAVAALYFDDSSEYKSALGRVVRFLDERLAGELLDTPKAAYDKACAMIAAAPAAQAPVQHNFNEKQIEWVLSYSEVIHELKEQSWADAEKFLRDLLAKHAAQAPVTAGEQPPQGFIDYVARNYNGEVVFANPEWHARRLWKAAMHHAATSAAQAPDAKDAERYRFEQKREYADYVKRCPEHGLKPLSFDEYKAKSDGITDAAMQDNGNGGGNE